MNSAFERIQFITNNQSENQLLDSVERVCKSGVRWIQYRNKISDEKKILEEAVQVKTICDKYNSKLIINDHPLICLQIKANGVHLGKDDMKISEARKILGNEFIIGGSTHSIEDIEDCINEGADYVGLGPLNFSLTKKDLKPVLRKTGFEKIMNEYEKKNLKIPVYAIGGVTENDIDFLLSIGIYGIAVSSMISNSADIKESVLILKEKFKTEKI